MEICLGIIGHRVKESGNAKLLRSTAETQANTRDAQHKATVFRISQDLKIAVEL